MDVLEEQAQLGPSLGQEAHGLFPEICSRLTEQCQASQYNDN
jgi:hypothetical protein